ncbi:2327b58f-6206-4579-beb0-158c3c6ff53f [Sclerotinia trifoliorum]|uniref:2327b58f-6206-4579-beb0-158c3c6ff53f n=1 Tax=Sclerotinia trifoliorum TaxID=28548 RepID=A0A8H2ZQA9_9HELO|nr:2327b58f-6206-4579-beb0-158c3c6ff53f [Sclerotinia trifoliorum]
MVSVSDHSFHMLSRHMGNQNENDFPLFPESNMYSPQFPYNGMPNFHIEHDASYAYPRTQDVYPTSTGFDSTTMYSEVPQNFMESPELRGAAPSNYSTASGPSATSSTIGSPNSNNGHMVSVPEWGSGLGINPSIVNYDNFGQGTDYNFSAGMEDFTVDFNSAKPGFVGEYPSILHAPFSATRPTSAVGQAELSPYQAPIYPTSPSPSQLSSRSPGPAKADSASPYLGSQYYPYPPPMVRRPSLTISHQSYGSQDGNFSGEDSKEKGRCTWPECGKVFKDLKAHMLTHQNERPEKCPIQTCDYHVKGFARKYDKNRHTLTHYKGTMVCGFCPGSGSAAEKSFNRADVFKRHLTSVHAVEQTPPNSRKKTSANINSGKKLSGYAPDATGKCSTCSATFSNAQDFYEHLDDCVLRIVQQEEPSEAINARRLAEVEQDHDVHETLRNNALPVTTNIYPTAEDEDEEEVDDENDDDYTIRTRTSRKGRQNRNPANGVQKSRGMTHSKGGVTLNTKGRKKRKDYPSSWGCPTSQMKMKKRVLTVFDGPRRLWKDDMMLDTDYEVRIKLGDEKAYVTDLDVQTLRRADAFHNATDEEKGPWIADDLTGMDLEKLMEVKREM